MSVFLKNIKGIFLLVVILISCEIYGQSELNLSNFYKEKLQKADTYFNSSDYLNAIEIYKEILEKSGEDTSIICRIADSYRLLNDSKNSEDWYSKAITNNKGTINPKYLLYFGQALTANNKYDEAIVWYKEYYRLSTDKRALESIHSLENVSELYYDTTFFIVYTLDINTKFFEFGSTFFRDGILFLSDRESKKAGFYSWYFSSISPGGSLNAPKRYNKGFKMEYNEGPVTFYDQSTKMIFSQNYLEMKAERKKITEIPLQLFYSQLESDDKWSDLKVLPFVKPEYSYSQPSITSDGKALYFSSNMEGGFGGTDIYVSSYDGSAWALPVNLGDKINTAGNETFPFIFQDSVLFFSSDGHGGLGSLDIFKINLKASDQLKNLGMPINSPLDDFGLIMDAEGVSGYFSSNRLNSKGLDDIYGFKQIRITVSIKIIDQKTKLPVAGAKIFTMEDDNKPIGITGDNGMCDILIPVCEVFKVLVKKENYETMVYTFQKVKPFSDGIAIIPVQTEVAEEIVLLDENDKEITDTQNIVYKVQIWASRRKASPKELALKYRGNRTIDYYYEDRWHKYTIGTFSTYKDAKECLISADVHDAFIIASQNNRKVHISVAKKITNETYIASPGKRR